MSQNDISSSTHHQPIYHQPIYHQPIYHQPIYHQPIYHHLSSTFINLSISTYHPIYRQPIYHRPTIRPTIIDLSSTINLSINPASQSFINSSSHVAVRRVPHAVQINTLWSDMTMKPAKLSTAMCYSVPQSGTPYSVPQCFVLQQKQQNNKTPQILWVNIKSEFTSIPQKQIEVNSLFMFSSRKRYNINKSSPTHQKPEERILNPHHSTGLYSLFLEELYTFQN
jgi:hypothetical protein